MGRPPDEIVEELRRQLSEEEAKSKKLQAELSDERHRVCDYITAIKNALTELAKVTFARPEGNIVGNAIGELRYVLHWAGKPEAMCDASAPFGQFGNVVVCRRPLPCKLHKVKS